MDKDLYSAVLSLDSIVIFIAILIVCWLGSLAKDFIIVFKGEEKVYMHLTFKYRATRVALYLKVRCIYTFKYRATRVALSTATSTLLVFALSDTIIDHIGFKGLLFISLMVGIVGFELLERISTLNRIIEIIDLIVFKRSADVRDYKDAVSDNKTKVIIKKIYISDSDKKNYIEDDDEEDDETQ